MQARKGKFRAASSQKLTITLRVLYATKVMIFNAFTSRKFSTTLRTSQHFGSREPSSQLVSVNLTLCVPL
jgi:hypothetical protein